MIQLIRLFGLGLLLCLSCCSSLVQAQTIVGDGADTSPQSDTAGAQGGGFYGNLNLGSSQIRIGRWIREDGSNVSAVYVFQLPDLGAVVDPFTSADLEFSFLQFDTTTDVPTYNVDLYGIDRRVDPLVVLADDFFAGPGPDPNAVALQEDILTPAIEVGRYNSVDIASYLNAQYAGGAGIGEYVFLRFSADYDPVISDTREGYIIASATATNVTDVPVINYTTAATSVVLGDANLDGVVDFLDITPFIALVSGGFLDEADIDRNGEVNFLDIVPFIAILSGS